MSFLNKLYIDKNLQKKLLNESTISSIYQQFPAVKSYEEMTMKSPLYKLDPTYNGGDQVGKYTKWIYYLYNNLCKDFKANKSYQEAREQGMNIPKPQPKSADRLEDFEKLPKLLTEFNTISKVKPQDLFQFKSIAELYQFIDENRNVLQQEALNSTMELMKKSIKLGSQVLLDDDKFLAIATPTYECNHVFSQVTNWCTTSHDGYYFNYYLKDENDRYIVILYKAKNKLFQFHANSNQFKDSSDAELRKDTLASMFYYDPNLAKLYIEEFKRIGKSKQLKFKRDIFTQAILDEYPDIFDVSVSNITNYINMFEGVSDIQEEDTKYKFIVGRESFKDLIEECYDESGRDTISFDTVKYVLDGNVFDIVFDWFYDVRWEETYDDGYFTKMMKELGHPEFTWNTLTDLYSDENLTEEQMDKIQTIIDEDADNEGRSLNQLNADCYTHATEAEMEKDILGTINSLCSSDFSLSNDNPVSITVSKELIDKYIAAYDDEEDCFNFDGNEYSGDCWLKRVISDNYERQGNRYIDMFESIAIQEPYNGWNDFDNDEWHEGLKELTKKISSVLDGSEANL